jgi:hypothetical protein
VSRPEILAEIPPRCRNPKCRKVRKPRRRWGGYEGARGWCITCYDRARIAGFPPEGVPDPMTRAECAAASNAERQRERDERMAEYAAYLRGGCSRERAARYVGVSADTGYRYERLLRSQEAESLAA